jgi:enoyl-CoA hydratase/carnithine racemase
MTDHAGAAASAATTPELRVERRGAALWVWINREARRNAMNAAVLGGIAAALDTAAADPQVRAVVLTGTGDKAFCAGADLSEGTGTFRSGSGAAVASEDPTTDFGRLARAVRRCGVPLIARVNGACVAGGMGLMALCDLAVAAEHARFGLPEVKVGVFPMQVLVLLRATMHQRHINELCLTGELIPAVRAAELGLINEVAPAGELDARVEALLAKLRAASPSAVRRGKQALFAMEVMAFDQAISYAEAQIGQASRSADAEEGLAAFNEKRKPRWATD